MKGIIITVIIGVVFLIFVSVVGYNYKKELRQNAEEQFHTYMENHSNG